jgi:hypothetical protein
VAPCWAAGRWQLRELSKAAFVAFGGEKRRKKQRNGLDICLRQYRYPGYLLFEAVSRDVELCFRLSLAQKPLELSLTGAGLLAALAVRSSLRYEREDLTVGGTVQEVLVLVLAQSGVVLFVPSYGPLGGGHSLGPSVGCSYLAGARHTQEGWTDQSSPSPPVSSSLLQSPPVLLVRDLQLRFSAPFKARQCSWQRLASH